LKDALPPATDPCTNGADALTRAFCWQNHPEQQQPTQQQHTEQELQTVSSAGSNAANELDVWAIDRGTQRLIDHALRLGPVCTFTVCEGAPMKITRKEVWEAPRQFCRAHLPYC